MPVPSGETQTVRPTYGTIAGSTSASTTGRGPIAYGWNARICRERESWAQVARVRTEKKRAPSGVRVEFDLIRASSGEAAGLDGARGGSGLDYRFRERP